MPRGACRPTGVVRGRVLNGSFCQNLPFVRREIAWQQSALISTVRLSCVEPEQVDGSVAGRFQTTL